MGIPLPINYKPENQKVPIHFIRTPNYGELLTLAKEGLGNPNKKLECIERFTYYFR